MQLLAPKDSNPSGAKRIKLTVSDGVHKCTALLASQLKDLVDNGSLKQGAIIKVTELVSNKQLEKNGGGQPVAMNKK